jgi:predicted metal-dependent enzyme (double-stranded beta helix superfamily)
MEALMEQNNLVDNFIVYSKEIINEQGINDNSLATIAKELSSLSTIENLFKFGNHRGRGANAAESYVLYEDPDPHGPVLQLAKFDGPTAIHNHGSWGVLCGYIREQYYSQWALQEDDPNKVTQMLDTIIKPGDFVSWPDVPNDIHKQIPVQDDVWVIIYMGRNAFDTVRITYD